MKELFQMLNDPRFHLLYGVTQRFSTGPEPRLVRLNREGFKLVEGVTKKTLVHPRMRLAVHPSPLKGDAFSPIFGRICEINERSIFVEAVEPNEEQRLAAELVHTGLKGNACSCGGLLEDHTEGLTLENIVWNAVFLLVLELVGKVQNVGDLFCAEIKQL